jgi:hypothetical protein
MKSRVTKVLSDNAPRVEGEAFYALQSFHLASDVAVLFRCFEQLPLTDAVGLLSGDDQTGLIVWEGTLKLLQYLYETKYLSERLDEALMIVELGCGCGALSTGVLQLLQRDACDHQRPPVVLATDGNDECVSLARRNMESVEAGAVRERLAATYLWDTDLPQALMERVACSSSQTVDDAARHCLVLSGDVIYSSEAIVPLVRTVQRIADVAKYPVRWLLSYIPRSLTKGANDRIFDELQLELGKLNTLGKIAFLAFPSPANATVLENRWWEESSEEMQDVFRDCGFLAMVTVGRSA